MRVHNYWQKNPELVGKTTQRIIERSRKIKQRVRETNRQTWQSSSP